MPAPTLKATWAAMTNGITQRQRLFGSAFRCAFASGTNACACLDAIAATWSRTSGLRLLLEERPVFHIAEH